MNWLDFYFAFAGRISRRQYWLGYQLPAAAILIVAVVGLPPTPEYLLPFVLSLVVVGVPGFAVGAKRLHDFGVSGWLQIIWLLAPLGSLVLIAMCGFGRGDAGPNAYGEPPLAEG